MLAIWFDDLSSLGSNAFAERRWRWCRQGPGSRTEGEGTLTEISRELENDYDEVRLLICARECLDLWLKTPPMNARRLKQAIPYIAEELLAQPVEAMHFAIGARRTDRLRCLAISRPLLSALLDALDKRNIFPQAAYSDAGLMRCKDDCLRLLRDKKRVLVRTAEVATEVPSERLPIFVDAWLREAADSEAETVIELVGDETQELEKSLANTNAKITSRKLAGSSLAEILPPLQISEPNLLVGDFEPRTSTGQTRPWRLPLALAAAFLAMLVASDLVVGILAKQRASMLIEESMQVYGKAYPTQEPSGEAVVRLVNREQGTRSQETRELLEALDRVSSLFFAQGASVKNLSYEAGTGAIDVEVLVQGYDTLDALESQVASGFEEVSMLGATQTQEGVRARLRLSGVGR